VRNSLIDAHVATPSPLPLHLIEKSGVNGYGKAIHYFLNYSSSPQRFVYSQGAGNDLLTTKSVARSQTIDLAPWDLVIIEEN
jgi:beta-galactosidase